MVQRKRTRGYIGVCLRDELGEFIVVSGLQLLAVCLLDFPDPELPVPDHLETHRYRVSQKKRYSFCQSGPNRDEIQIRITS